MSFQPPNIDPRSYEQIVAQTEELAQKFTPWRPRSDGKPDAGRGLIRIFGRLASLASDRLNRVPQKNFLSFLDLIGTQIQPPQPARVPLSFHLVAGSPPDALVPGGTQVAVPPAEGQEEEVVFETERDLVLTTAKLQAAFVREPKPDLYSDRTSLATSTLEDTAFPVFVGEQPIEHYVYLAAEELFGIPENKRIVLKFDSASATDLEKLFGTWSYWDGNSWQPLNDADLSLNVTTRKLQVAIEKAPLPVTQNVHGVEARWLRVALKPSELANSSLPSIATISLNATLQVDATVPDSCFANQSALDISKDFYPFGEQPRFNDTFYIASQQAFAYANSRIAIAIELSDDRPVKANNVELLWEVWNGSNWQTLDSQLNFSDETQALTQAGKIEFDLPSPIGLATVNGENNYWVRTRIVKGNYGEAAQTRQRQTTDDPPQPMYDQYGHPIYEYVPESFAPPSIKSLKLSYTYNSGDRPLSACLAYNDFKFVDGLRELNFKTVLASAVKKGDTRVELETVTGLKAGDRLQIAPNSKNSGTYDIEAIDVSEKRIVLAQPPERNYNKNTSVSCCFLPLRLTEDRNPTLYMGFDRPFPNRAIALYAWVEPPKPGEIADAIEKNDVTAPPELVWEYASAEGWKLLGVRDETTAFRDRGMIRFIGPSDFASSSEFGQSLYWLRVRWQSGQFLVHPHCQGLLTNTVWASQAITIAEEILGSSDGNPNQKYLTSQIPVLLGEQLQVLEPTVPSSTERAKIEEVEGSDAIEIVEDEAGKVEGAWIKWHEVPDFYGSGPSDRHYVLDRLAGEVRFGDGQAGKIPPQGRNNIRLAPYRTGGGVRGNQPAESIIELKTSVPYVDRVTNLVPASGGGDRESWERLQERGPKALRHRDRAVTVEDIQDLAYEVSTQIARAKAIAPHFDPIDGLASLPIYQISLNGPGEIRVQLSNLPDRLTLEVKINGPGRSIPYAAKSLNHTDALLTYTVTPEQFALGKEWTVTLKNLGASMQEKAQIKISYPTGSKTDEFQAVGIESQEDNNPYKSVTDAGRVELIVVPRIADRQPTPSLSLLEQVGRYIRARCAPGMDVRVTEPVWVEVTVEAGIVPISQLGGDRVKEAAAIALVNFLHPLTGGATGEGWEFGRRPHLSDFYAVLEKIEGVEYVDSLSFASSPSLDEMPANRGDRFLIYSGTHQISLI